MSGHAQNSSKRSVHWRPRARGGIRCSMGSFPALAARQGCLQPPCRANRNPGASEGNRTMVKVKNKTRLDMANVCERTYPTAAPIRSSTSSGGWGPASDLLIRTGEADHSAGGGLHRARPPNDRTGARDYLAKRRPVVHSPISHYPATGLAPSASLKRRGRPVPPNAHESCPTGEMATELRERLALCSPEIGRWIRAMDQVRGSSYWERLPM
jgi:hypothetical protein